MVKKRKKKSQQKLYYFGGIVFLLFFVLIILLPSVPAKFISFGANDSDMQFVPQGNKNSLQLYWFLPATPTKMPKAVFPPMTFPLVPPSSSQPPDSPPIDRSTYPPSKGCGISHITLRTSKENGKCCVQDGPVESPNDCCSTVPFCDLTTNPPKASEGISCSCGGNSANRNTGGGTSNSFSGTCNGQYKYWCNAKPVIYLYPTVPSVINVQVQVPGEITVSDPLYPKEGWRDVTAYPNGTLMYKGSTYHELFYESSVTPTSPPKTGIVVPFEQVESMLRHFTIQLGLRSDEQAEFIAYWIPRLTELKKPYVLLSLFTQEEKEQIDNVTITPKPDTFIQMIFYFKGLDKPVSIKPLKLPSVLPQRYGFTAVEWGGILDQ